MSVRFPFSSRPYGGATSVLARVPDPACHRRDERRSLPAAVLRLEEGHLALRRQVRHCVVHDTGETWGEREERETKETREDT